MSSIQGAKAISLVTRGGVTEATGRIFLAQGSHGDTHTITFVSGQALCTCTAGRRGALCYHVKAARLLMAKQRDEVSA